MKYFTKEWYSLPCDRTICMKPCEDRIYSDEEIQKLYQKALKKEIRDEKKFYNEPPFFLPLDFDEMELDSFLLIDEETGESRHPSSIEEAKKNFEEEQRRAMEEYENRPPFDESVVVSLFAECYENKKANCPEGLQRELFALDLLPKSIYDKWKKEDKANQKVRDRIEKSFLKDQSAKDLFEVSLHDGEFVSFDGTTLVLKTEEEEIVKVTFTEPQILENEVKEKDWMLYDEAYQTDEGYELHFLTMGEELHYLTIKAKNVEIQIEN